MNDIFVCDNPLSTNFGWFVIMTILKMCVRVESMLYPTP